MPDHTMCPDRALRPSALSPSTSAPESAPVLAGGASDEPVSEAYHAALARRLPLVRALLGQAADAARSPLARREAARLAAATLAAAGELLSAWRDELAYQGDDFGSWARQTADDLGDALARAEHDLRTVLAMLPAAPARLARTLRPASAARAAGGAA